MLFLNQIIFELNKIFIALVSSLHETLNVNGFQVKKKLFVKTRKIQNFRSKKIRKINAKIVEQRNIAALLRRLIRINFKENIFLIKIILQTLSIHNFNP